LQQNFRNRKVYGACVIPGRKASAAAEKIFVQQNRNPNFFFIRRTPFSRVRFRDLRNCQRKFFGKFASAEAGMKIFWRENLPDWFSL
jgi:hypothetical protein